MREKIKAVLEARFLLLFLSFVLLFVAYPFLGEDSFYQQIALDILFLLILLGAIRAVISGKKQLLFLIALAILSQGLSWADLFFQHPAIFAARIVVDLPLFSFFAVAILVYVLKQKKISADTIFAAICVYAMIGFIWAIFYAMIGTYNPSAFNFANIVSNEGLSGAAKESAYIYFSYVTLTTLGYGDITPVSRVACSLACLEAIIGQLFLATLIARLVGLQIISHKQESKKGD